MEIDHNNSTSENRIETLNEISTDLRALISGSQLAILKNIFGTSAYTKPSDCYLLMHAHCIPSFVILIGVLVEKYKFPAENIVIVSKLYSTIPEAENHLRRLGVMMVPAALRFRIGRYDDAQYKVLWDTCQFLRARVQGKRNGRIIVVDDGGLISTIWSTVNRDAGIETISVQHTASGIGRKGSASYRVNVAQSAAKQIFEAAIIAKAVIRKLEHLDLPLHGARIGVVGYGAIGRALAHSLAAKGHRPIVLEHPRAMARLPRNTYFDPEEFLSRSDVIFGCSGVNWSSAIRAAHQVTDKIFVSCSSRDVEFKHLLETFSTGAVVTEIDDVCLSLASRAKVLNGGFPINFDRKREWESAGEIGLTRYLILSAILFSQFLDTTRETGDTLMLPVVLQQRMVRDWLAATGYSSVQFGVSVDQLANERWWYSNSGGVEYQS